MKTELRIGALLAASIAIACAVGCGDDDDSPPDDDGGEAGETNGGIGNNGGTGNDGGTGNNGGTGNTGGDDPIAGAGGAGPSGCNVYDPDRPIEDIPTDAQGVVEASGATLTLTSDTTWRINGRIFVPEGVTLEIEPCTLVVATARPDAGSLFITRGAQIQANGTAEEPIVFTSEDYRFRANAPWGGVVLLGNAPIGSAEDVPTATPERIFEGLTDPLATYGGEDPEDSSGSMSYVRIEYGGDIIVSDREINGLTLGGVGSGTDLHHIMVKRTMDDCFEFFGGTVDAHHLVCENAGDDMYDADENYRGHLQFLFGRLSEPGTSADPNGFEWDGNQPNEAYAERSQPKASNATLCGLGSRAAATAFGAVFRRGIQEGTLVTNSIVTGFDVGLDTRTTSSMTTTVVWDAAQASWTNSLFFAQNNVANTFAFPTEGGTGNPADNDGGFDEFAWLTDAANENDDTAPDGFDCYANPPAPFPAEAIAGGTPAATFPDDTADYVGAFRDADDDWMTGLWVDWSSGD